MTITKEQREEWRRATAAGRLGCIGTLDAFDALYGALDEMEQQRDAASGDIERELRATGKITDCSHVACHSSIADGWCVRHELAYRMRLLSDATISRQQFQRLAEQNAAERDAALRDIATLKRDIEEPGMLNPIDCGGKEKCHRLPPFAHRCLRHERERAEAAEANAEIQGAELLNHIAALVRAGDEARAEAKKCLLAYGALPQQ